MNEINLYTRRSSALRILESKFENYRIHSGMKDDWFFITLKLSEVDSWLPIFHQVKNMLLTFYFGFYQTRGPLLQYMGFEVEGSSMDLENIFLDYKWVERTKENFLELQQKLFESNFEIQAGIDPTYINEIDKIYEAVKPA